MNKKETEEKKEAEVRLDATNAAAQRLEDANKTMAELVTRQEELQERKVLGGESEAGVKTVEQTEEEKQIESARNMLKGTGYAESLFPQEGK